MSDSTSRLRFKQFCRERRKLLVGIGLAVVLVLGRHQAVSQWVKQNCSVVDGSAYSNAGSTSMDSSGFGSNPILYECGQ